MTFNGSNGSRGQTHQLVDHHSSMGQNLALKSITLGHGTRDLEVMSDYCTPLAISFRGIRRALSTAPEAIITRSKSKFEVLQKYSVLVVL
ncbi:hypothetical protein VTN77DRAFT_6623 [Rasamsonia byssochlamydoides]|uniref:uncharacterized protein n=1 Tax=Rasamsonia byssochlamydoides TaxID=89139 RepID=UPI003742B967